MVPIIWLIATGTTHLNEHGKYFFFRIVYEHFFFGECSVLLVFMLLSDHFSSIDDRQRTGKRRVRMKKKTKHNASDLWSSSSVCTDIRSVHYDTRRRIQCAPVGRTTDARISNLSDNMRKKWVKEKKGKKWDEFITKAARTTGEKRWTVRIVRSALVFFMAKSFD